MFVVRNPPREVVPFHERAEARRRRQLEHTAIQTLPTYPTLSYSLANLRGLDLRAEADRARLLQIARVSRTGPTRFATVRRLVGAALIRTGERVQAGAIRPVAEVVDLAAHPRFAR